MSDHDPLRCIICVEKFDEEDHIPRILSQCGHTFCSWCLNELRAIGGVPNGIKCPTCREVTRLFSVSDLHRNYTVLDMVSAQTPQTDAPETAGKCAECAKMWIAFFCEQCDTDYCEQCYNKIHFLKVFQSHEKIPIAEKPYQLPKCEVHPKERAEFSCKTCGTDNLLCAKCLLGSHRNHHARMDAIEIMKANERTLKCDFADNNYEYRCAKAFNHVLSDVKESFAAHGNHQIYQEKKEEIRMHYEEKMKEAMAELDAFAAEQYKMAEEQEKKLQVPESTLKELEEVQMEIHMRLNSKKMHGIQGLTERSIRLRKNLKTEPRNIRVDSMQGAMLHFESETMQIEHDYAVRPSLTISYARRASAEGADLVD